LFYFDNYLFSFGSANHFGVQKTLKKQAVILFHLAIDARALEIFGTENCASVGKFCPGWHKQKNPSRFQLGAHGDKLPLNQMRGPRSTAHP
jgi:hypothetical protein